MEIDKSEEADDGLVATLREYLETFRPATRMPEEERPAGDVDDHSADIEPPPMAEPAADTVEDSQSTSQADGDSRIDLTRLAIVEKELGSVESFHTHVRTNPGLMAALGIKQQGADSLFEVWTKATVDLREDPKTRQKRRKEWLPLVVEKAKRVSKEPKVNELIVRRVTQNIMTVFDDDE